jgi:oligoendopeptidase F
MNQVFLIGPREPFDWKTLEPFYQKLLEEDLSAARVPSWLLEWSGLESVISEAWSVAQRAKYEDTANEVAEKIYLHLVENVTPHHQRLTQALTKKLLAVNYKPSSEHEQMLKRFRVEEELFREENIPVFQEIDKLNSHYEKLDGSLMVELDGETLTIPKAASKLEEPGRPQRERAYRAILKAQRHISEALDGIILELVKQRKRLANNAGFANFRDYHWQAAKRFDYSPEDCLEFISSIEYEVTPVLANLWEKRRQRLKIDTLRPWDFGADPGSRPALKPFKTVKELEDGLERIFSNLDPVLGKQFASMRDGWLDLEDRPNKLSGIGCHLHFPLSRMPYIYYSVAGTNTNVSVMLHEMGHAFQGFTIQTAQPLLWNHWPSTAFLEVASQAMELLGLPYYEKSNGGFYSSEDSARAVENQLLHVLMDFLRMARQAALHHWLYSEAPLNLSASQIDEKWKDLGQRFYPFVDWRDLDEERTKGWQDFSTFVTPFSDLDYSIASLGAIQIWQNSLKDKKKALEQYRYALSLGASRSLPELFEAAGAKFAFDQRTVRELVRFVEAQLEF